MKKENKPSHPVPQRTCVACRTVGGKRGLIRLVRRPDGDVIIDESGRQPGRGAYLCRKAECWQEGASRLEYALKTKLSPGDKEKLTEQGKALLELNSQ